jgi:hypothetical protein
MSLFYVTGAIKELVEEYTLFHCTPENLNKRRTNLFSIYYDGIEFDIKVNTKEQETEIEVDGHKVTVKFDRKKGESIKESVKDFILNYANERMEKDRLHFLFEEKRFFYDRNTPFYEEFISETIHQKLKEYYSIDEIETYCAKLEKSEDKKVEMTSVEVANNEIYYVKRLEHYFLVIGNGEESNIQHFLPEERLKGLEEYRKTCRNLFEEYMENEIKGGIK